MKTQIIYYSRYGSTRDVAFAIGKILSVDNITDICDLEEISGDLVIVGSGIYGESAGREIMRLLGDKENRLRDRHVALFAVCLAREYRKVGDIEIGGPVYLRKMEDALGRPPVAAQVFGGRMIIDELEDDVRKGQEAFYKRRGLPFQDVDLMSSGEVREFVDSIRAHPECGNV